MCQINVLLFGTIQRNIIQIWKCAFFGFSLLIALLFGGKGSPSHRKHIGSINPNCDVVEVIKGKCICLFQKDVNVTRVLSVVPFLITTACVMREKCQEQTRSVWKSLHDMDYAVCKVDGLLIEFSVSKVWCCQ